MDNNTIRPATKADQNLALMYHYEAATACSALLPCISGKGWTKQWRWQYDHDQSESFHWTTKVHAPYVRQAGLTLQATLLQNMTFRFTQPNKNIMPTGAVHALEHFLAGFLREELSDVIDLSPMGCRTGFYLIRLGEASETEIAQALIRSLDKILAADSVPARSAVQCGNYRDLSLFGAQEYAKEVQAGKEKCLSAHGSLEPWAFILSLVPFTFDQVSWGCSPIEDQSVWG